MSGLLHILQLLLSLEGFDEGFLCEVLGIIDVPDDTVNLYKDAAQVLRDKPASALGRFLEDRV